MRIAGIVVGWLAALAVAVTVFALIGGSVIADGADLFATWGWWGLLALLFPAGSAVWVFLNRD